MNPTEEQTAALDLFSLEEDLVVEAGAGTGKTSTLVLMAEDTTRTGRYLAFNRSIVEDAKRRMPGNMKVSTIHSAAFGVIGADFSHRLKSPRMMSWEIARILGIDDINVPVGGKEKRLGAPFLAGQVMEALRIFCQSADPEPSERHFPFIEGIDEPYADGRRSYQNNNLVAKYLLPNLDAAWRDACDPGGRLRYGHDRYLKMWERGMNLNGSPRPPRIGTDFIMVDEAQDLSPVMASIVEQQTHAQRIYVGDSAQAIYGWMGAVNAIANVMETGVERTMLTKSFRFGQVIADVANDILELVPGIDMRLSGNPAINSTIDVVDAPDAFLSRTNAGTINRLFKEYEDGNKPHLLGGGKDVITFAKAAKDLQENGRTSFPELACFESWGEVRMYVEEDAQGGELKLMVGIVDDFGADAIIEALHNQPTEAKASIVLSTAHKAKGREWDKVYLGDDFPGESKASPEELRLGYVAVTRAQSVLDTTVFSLHNSIVAEAMADAEELAELEEEI